jgi:hypothetical protein
MYRAIYDQRDERQPGHVVLKGSYTSAWCAFSNRVVLVALWSMHVHIAAHILREHVTSHVCGFCGLLICINTGAADRRVQLPI